MVLAEADETECATSLWEMRSEVMPMITTRDKERMWVLRDEVLCSWKEMIFWRVLSCGIPLDHI